jgi:MoaD family protein
MNIKVKYYNLLQEALGKKEETYQMVKGCTLADLINKVAAEHGEKIRKILFHKTDILASHIRVFVNDKLIYDLAIPLDDGAEVALFYAVVGG